MLVLTASPPLLRVSVFGEREYKTPSSSLYPVCCGSLMILPMQVGEQNEVCKSSVSTIRKSTLGADLPRTFPSYAKVLMSMGSWNNIHEGRHTRKGLRRFNCSRPRGGIQNEHQWVDGHHRTETLQLKQARKVTSPLFSLTALGSGLSTLPP